MSNLFAFGFAAPRPGVLPKMIPKITRTDMGLVLPRLDVACLDDKGNTDVVKKQALEAEIAKFSAVYVLGGRVDNTKLTKGKGDEPGVRFTGAFRAVINPLIRADSIFISARCHVPKFFEEVLYANVLTAKANDDKATLEFLIGIGLKPPAPGKPSITGYEWTVEPLVDLAAADDPVSALFDRGRQRALAGPASGQAETGTTATAPSEFPADSNEGRHGTRQGRAARA